MPCTGITNYIQMTEPVCQCFRHIVSYRLVSHTIARRYDNTILRQLMFPDHSIQRDLIGRCLRRRRSRRNLVKEQYVHCFRRLVHLKDFWFEPNGKRFVCIGCRDAAQIDRVKKEQAHIRDRTSSPGLRRDTLRNLPHALGFADTRRPPKHDRRERRKRRPVVYERNVSRTQQVYHLIDIERPDIILLHVHSFLKALVFCAAYNRTSAAQVKFSQL